MAEQREMRDERADTFTRGEILAQLEVRRRLMDKWIERAVDDRDWATASNWQQRQQEVVLQLNYWATREPGEDWLLPPIEVP